MTEYMSNSHKSREQNNNMVPGKRVNKIISGTARTKKKGELSKLADIFISEDISSVKSYVIFDVIIPNVKKGILDTLHMLFYGTTDKRSTASKVSYQKYYDNRSESRNRTIPRDRSGMTYDDVVLETRGEAESVLDTLGDIIDQYGFATIGDLYDLVGITAPYTTNKYGWTDLRGANIKRTMDGGYAIEMPRSIPIN